MYNEHYCRPLSNAYCSFLDYQLLLTMQEMVYFNLQDFKPVIHHSEHLVSFFF